MDDEMLTNLANKEWRMNNLYYIKNKDGGKTLFKMNEAQADFHENRRKRNIILKSRQLGFTTYECIRKLDDVLFSENTDSLLISYDTDSSNDIFDNKIDFAWSNLPEEVRKLFTVSADNKNTLKLGFGNGSESSIYVRSSGRSGTYHDVHISEFAKICLKYPDKAKEIITGTIPAVPMNGQIDIESTAEGQDGAFYNMFWSSWGKKDSDLEITDYKAFFYNWQWDVDEIEKIGEPKKDLPQEFREYQRKHDLSDLEITYYYLKWIGENRDWALLRQEYPTTPEEAFEVSVEGAYYHECITQARADNRICKIAYSDIMTVDTFWDIGLDDEMVILFCQRFGKEIRIIDVYHNNGQALEHYFLAMAEKKYKFGTHYLPWDARIKSVRDNKSIQDDFNESDQLYPTLGLRNNAIVENTSVIHGINLTRKLFANFYFDEVKCGELLKLLIRYRKDWDDKNGRFKDKPVHDMSSHFADPLRYMGITYQQNILVTKKRSYEVPTHADPITGYVS